MKSCPNLPEVNRQKQIVKCALLLVDLKGAPRVHFVRFGIRERHNLIQNQKIQLKCKYNVQRPIYFYLLYVDLNQCCHICQSTTRFNNTFPPDFHGIACTQTTSPPPIPLPSKLLLIFKYKYKFRRVDQP